MASCPCLPALHHPHIPFFHLVLHKGECPRGPNRSFISWCLFLTTPGHILCLELAAGPLPCPHAHSPSRRCSSFKTWLRCYHEAFLDSSRLSFPSLCSGSLRLHFILALATHVMLAEIISTIRLRPLKGFNWFIHNPTQRPAQNRS